MEFGSAASEPMSGTAASLGRWTGPGLVLVFLTAGISGVSTFVNAYAVAGTNSDAFVTVRNLSVALLLVPVVVLARRSVRAPLRSSDWLRLVTIGVVGGAIPFLLFFRGLQLATLAGGATTASFTYRTLFLMATVLGLVFLRERFHWRVVLAAALLLGGNLLLLSLTSPIWTDGTAYVLAATGLWALEYTLSKRALQDLPSTTVGLGRMGFGALVLIAYLAATAQLGSIGTMTGAQWNWVALSAILLVAFVGSWYAGLQRIDLGVATSILVLGFPVTWILAVLIRGSSFTLVQATGAVVVVVGAFLAVGLSMFRETGAYLAQWTRSRIRPSA